MSQVKRVRQGFDLMELGKEYVLASDCAALESDRDALLESLENLVMFINADCCTDKATQAAELLIAKCRGIEE